MLIATLLDHANTVSWLSTIPLLILATGLTAWVDRLRGKRRGKRRGFDDEVSKAAIIAMFGAVTVTLYADIQNGTESRPALAAALAVVVIGTALTFPMARRYDSARCTVRDALDRVDPSAESPTT